MTQQQKVSVIALGVFAIAAITLGLLHVNQGLMGAVAWKPKEKTIEQTQKKKEDTALDLQSKDTDGDGLNDFEELQVFSTSPYLADTDGDNVDDAKEVQSGSDPNCPEGKTCGAGEAEIAGAQEAAPSFNLSGAQQKPPEMPQELQQLLSGEGMDANQLRNLLKQSGVDVRTLEGVPDDQLMAVYGEVMKEFQAKGAGGLDAGALQGLLGGEVQITE
ncbi:MAG: hypothetical protein AAB579_04200 [Patescibacteria group bacterium]